jgi:hypothetical protein
MSETGMRSGGKIKTIQKAGLPIGSIEVNESFMS